MAKFTFSPVKSAKVSKAPSKKKGLCQKTSVTCDVLQTAKKTSIDYKSSRSKKKPMLRVKNATSAFFQPIHSSKVSKPGAKKPIKRFKNRTKIASTTRPYQSVGKNLCTLSIPSMDEKAMQHSANISLRRSTRMSKQPERFHLG